MSTVDAMVQTERSQSGNATSPIWKLTSENMRADCSRFGSGTNAPEPVTSRISHRLIGARSYKEYDMNMNPNPSHQAQARERLHTSFDAPDAVRRTRTTCYTCPTHAEVVRDAPQECAQCGATLIPMHQAIARAAMALRSLSAVTRALRLYPV